jgi:NAD(P)-dependent dehydrogenase (short-subunit alcohol dehydrogenase family)
MMLTLRDQVVVVTGGAVRVGRAIALACAEAGASVAITYRHSEAEAHETVAALHQASSTVSGGAASMGASFAAFGADVSKADNVKRLVGEVVDTFGRVTALVNNAAIFRRTPFDTMTEADFDDHIGANLKGPYLLSKQFGDVFLKQGGGAIVNIADIHGLRPLQNYIPYCISKAGVVMLTEALAKALAPTVRVNCECPGTVLLPSEEQGENDDEAALKRKIPFNRIGSPDEVSAAVVFLLAGPPFITGAVLPVDGAQRLR